MELALRFHKETNTEKEKPQIFELDPPRPPKMAMPSLEPGPTPAAAGPAPVAASRPMSTRTMSTAAKLDALWQAAKEAVKDQGLL